MSKHFIYHIFGKKIGVTNDIVRRMKEQSVKEGEYEILEEHTNAKTASVREIELQEQYGYPVDKIHYYKILRNAKKAQTPEAQKKRVNNTDYKVISTKRSISMDYKARTAKIDYKLNATKIDWKLRNTKVDFKAKAEKQQKSVLQFDKQGNFVKQWDSIKKASAVVNGNTTGIGNCCRGKGKSAGGYVWKYTN